MALHVVVGSGPVGTAVVDHLLAEGETVRVVTRSGSGPEETDRVAVDASDAKRLTEVTAGAAAIYNCVNPPYHQWATAWPPIADALLAAAEASGAVLATTGNLYGYGRVTAPMSEDTPLRPAGTKGEVRNRVWRDALAAHRAGRVRTFEVRGSDYLGGNSYLSTIVLPAWRKNRTAYVPADLDVPHTFTDVRDVAALLATGARDERAWGAAWHVPSSDAVSLRRLTGIAAEQLEVPGRVRALPYAAVWAYGLVNPFAKELRETQHQFRAPYVLDSSRAQATFGLTPHAIEDSVRFDIANGAPAPGARTPAAR